MILSVFMPKKGVVPSQTV